jgi:hypothetical protein
MYARAFLIMKKKSFALVKPHRLLMIELEQPASMSHWAYRSACIGLGFGGAYIIFWDL